MPFTMPNYQLLNPQQANPYADLVKNAMAQYQQGVQAKYAPQQQQADIFSKQFAPLATIASSPLASSMLPEQKSSINDLITKLLQQNLAGNPMPGGNGGAGAGIQTPMGNPGFRGAQTSGGAPGGGGGGMAQPQPNGGSMAGNGSDTGAGAAAGANGANMPSQTTMPRADLSVPNIMNLTSKAFPNNPVMARLAAAQAIQESGLNHVPSGLAVHANNIFGVKGTGDAGSVELPTTEIGADGKPHTEMAKFAKYSSLDAAMQAYMKTMQKSNYKGVLAAPDFNSAAQALGQSGYATDPGYGSSVAKIGNSLPQAGGGQAPMQGEQAPPVPAMPGQTVPGTYTAGTADQNTSNIPTTTDVGTNATGHAVAPYSTQFVEPGKTFKTPTEIRSALASGQIDQGQASQIAIQRSLPMLEILQAEGDKVLAPGKFERLTKAALAAAGNLAGISSETLKKYHLNKQDWDDYIQFKTNQNQTAEGLNIAYAFGANIPGQEKAQSQIENTMLEDGAAYHKRMANEILKLRRQDAIIRGDMTGGINETPGGQIETPKGIQGQPQITRYKRVQGKLQAVA